MLCTKDVKALKRKVEVSFPDLTADDLDVLFPPKVTLLLQRGLMHCLTHPKLSVNVTQSSCA